ncbi:MAG: glycosyl transferase family 2 [Phycisphaerales bacterium]|nr:glycosyl transferase family 2 [Phycisphaerales bacterium]
MLLQSSPRISVITPAYRSQDTLPAALLSLLAQNESRWESIVVDDGSPDESARIVERFARDDGRFRLVRQENAGACAARNTGLAVARGTFVVFLDADDWLEPHALAVLSDACKGRRRIAAHGLFRYAKPEGKPTLWTGGNPGGKPLFTALASSNILSVPSCVMLRRSVLDEVGAFDPSLAHCGDWDLWGRVARVAGPGQTQYVDRCVTGYRMRPTSLSRSPQTLLRDGTEVLRRLHSPDPRVKRPAHAFAAGDDPSELPARTAGFTLYAAGLSLAMGDGAKAESLLDSIDPWPALIPTDAAGYLLYAMCFARCHSPREAGVLWPELREPARELLEKLESRSRKPGLAEKVLNAMSELSDAAIPRVWRQVVEPVIATRSCTDTLAFEYLRNLARMDHGNWAAG